jgi:hypothetical protein
VVLVLLLSIPVFLRKEQTKVRTRSQASHRHLLTFLEPIPESNCPWSWVPGHSRKLAHGRLGRGILFPSVHGLQRPHRAYRHPPRICQPSGNVVLSCRLVFAHRLFATSRSSCEQSSRCLLCALADMRLAPLLVNIHGPVAPPFDLPCHWTSVVKRTRGSLRPLPMGGLRCCPLHRPSWDNCGRMEK